MFNKLKKTSIAPFQSSDESETGVFISAGIRAPYHKTNSQPFPIPELVFDVGATPEQIALWEKVRQAKEEKNSISHGAEDSDEGMQKGR
ncbi:TPA: hypothetical protein ACX485_001406 [Neisseria meningitidis]